MKGRWCIIKGHSGIALVTALLFMVVLFIITIAFLSFMGTDYHFSSYHQDDTQALLLAFSGLTYYNQDGCPNPDANGFCTQNTPPGYGGGATTHNFYVPVDPSNIKRDYFQIQVQPTQIKITGFAANRYGKIFAQRAIIKPNGSSSWSEP